MTPHDTPTREFLLHNRLGRRILGTLFGLAVLGGSVLFSCSVERDYKTLSIFFDGVPDPNARPAASPFEGPAAYGPKSGELLARPREAPRGSTHFPYVNRQCDGCHEFPESNVEQPNWMFGAPKLLAPLEELCAICHEPPEAAYVHGPVAMLRCDLCHAAHDSRYPHLLKKASVNETCTSCHLGQTFVTELAHGELGARDCSQCHDPHGADNSLFLKVGAPSLMEVPLPPADEDAADGAQSPEPGTGS